MDDFDVAPDKIGEDRVPARVQSVPTVPICRCKAKPRLCALRVGTRHVWFHAPAPIQRSAIPAVQRTCAAERAGVVLPCYLRRPRSKSASVSEL
jgi:hypothetical protein